jgi:hypothetical protein
MKRHHDEERPKGGNLGDVAQRVSGEHGASSEPRRVVNAREEAAGMAAVSRSGQRASDLHGPTLCERPDRLYL